MALATVTVTYDLSDLVGTDFDSRRTKVWATTNIDGDTVIDTVGNQIRLGDGKGAVNTDGTGSITLWAPGTGSNPDSWQTYIHVDYPRAANRDRKVRTFGPFTITTDADLADLVEEQEVPPNYITTVTAALDERVTEAEAARDLAQQYRDQAHDISGIATTDAAMTAVANNPASAFVAKQTASFAPVASTGRHPLTGMFHVTGYGAVGDGSTDNTTAIQNAYNACVAAGGGTVYFPARTTGGADYRYAFPLDLRGATVPVTLRGDSGFGDGTGPGVSLTYTGTGAAAAIRFGSSRNMKFEHLSIYYSSASFTGRLLDGQKKNPGSDTAYITFTDATIGGLAGVNSASMLVCIDGSHDIQFVRTRFLNASMGLVGKLTQGLSATGGYAIRVTLDSCSFAGMVTTAISNADESWDINAVFEPLTSGAAGAYAHDTGLLGKGVTFRSCWFGDDAPVAGSWIKWDGTGLSVDGGVISVGRLTTGVQFDGHNTRSTRIHTNFTGGGGTNKGVDFGATAGHVGVDIRSSFRGIAVPIAGTVPAGTSIDTGDGAYVTSPEFFGPITSGRLGPNLLTTNQASPTATTGYSVNANCTLSASGGVLTITATNTSEPSTYLASVPVTVGKQYTFQAEVDPGTTGRNALFDIYWLDAGAATVSTSTSGLMPLNSGGGYQLNSVTGVAPTGATQARVIMRIIAPVAAAETYNFRKMSLHRGPVNTWALPGATSGAASLDAAVGLELPEIVTPAAPGADLVRLYAKDNGAGKTQLTARFPTGSEIPVLTEGDTPLLATSVPRARWTASRYYTGGVEGARSTFAQTADRIILIPLDCPYGASIDQLVAEVTTAAAAGGRLRLGVYSDDGSGLPSALLVDAGDVDATVAGVKTITLGSTLTLTGAVRVWLAAAGQVAAPTCRTIGAAPDRRVGSSTAANATGANGQNAFIYNSAVSGAFPSTLTAASLNTGTQGTLVGVRAA